VSAGDHTSGDGFRTPAELQRDVLDELAWEPGIDPAA
jgi:hypothetical protein